MIDDSSPVPLYHQLYSLLRDRIAQDPGSFKGRFPSEHELRVTYGVSRVTVRHALERLEADGVIVRRPGRGTFLNPSNDRAPFIARDLNLLYIPDEPWEGRAARFSVSVLEAQRVPPSAEVVHALQLRPGETVLALRRLIRTDGQPMWIETRYLPGLIADGLQPDDFTEFSVMQLLARRRGIRVTRVDREVLAGIASISEARRLSIRAGAPVLITEYVSYAGPRPVQTGRTVFRADRYKFRMRISAPADGESVPPSIQMGVVPEPIGAAASAESEPPSRRAREAAGLGSPDREAASPGGSPLARPEPGRELA